MMRMESAMDCGRLEEERRACNSLHSSMGGARLAALY